MPGCRIEGPLFSHRSNFSNSIGFPTAQQLTLPCLVLMCCWCNSGCLRHKHEAWRSQTGKPISLTNVCSLHWPVSFLNGNKNDNYSNNLKISSRNQNPWIYSSKLKKMSTAIHLVFDYIMGQAIESSHKNILWFSFGCMIRGQSGIRTFHFLGR